MTDHSIRALTKNVTFTRTLWCILVLVHSHPFVNIRRKGDSYLILYAPALLSQRKNEPSQIVFLSVSWVSWCLGAGRYDRGRNRLRISHALPSLAKATAPGSRSRFEAPFRSTDSPHTHALHRPEHGAAGPHPGTAAVCISLLHSLTHIPHPLFHSCIMGRTSPLNCLPLVLLTLHEGAFL